MVAVATAVLLPSAATDVATPKTCLGLCQCGCTAATTTMQSRPPHVAVPLPTAKAVHPSSIATPGVPTAARLEPCQPSPHQMMLPEADSAAGVATTAGVAAPVVVAALVVMAATAGVAAPVVVSA